MNPAVNVIQAVNNTGAVDKYFKKSFIKISLTENNINNLEKEKKERVAKIKKIREVDPTYLLEEELNEI